VASRSQRVRFTLHNGHRSPYFNSYIDDANEQVQVFDLTYRASEVLFFVDQQAYRDILADHESVNSELGMADTTESTSGS
jgi:hypothetical protein